MREPSVSICFISLVSVAYAGCLKQPRGGSLTVMMLRLFKDDNVCIAFLMIETGQPLPSVRRYGCFPHWIRVASGLAESQTVVVNVEAGERLPTREGSLGR